MEDWIVIGLLVLVVTAWVARAGGVTRRDGRAPKVLEDRRQSYARAAETIVAYHVAGSGVPHARYRAACKLFDPEVQRELRHAGLSLDGMWAAFRRRWGTPPAEMTQEQWLASQPTLVTAAVRKYRALDEQLRRAGLPESDKPPDWVSFYAGGRIGLPDPAWSDSGAALEDLSAAPDIPAADEEVAALSAEARQGLARDAAARAPSDPVRALLRAVIEEAASVPALAELGVVCVPPVAGGHRAYDFRPWRWGRRYLHVFVAEPVGRTRADLMLSYGLKGHLFAFVSVVVDPAKRSARADALRAAGYTTFVFTPDAVAADPREAARAVLKPVADLLDDAPGTMLAPLV